MQAIPELRLKASLLVSPQTKRSETCTVQEERHDAPGFYPRQSRNCICLSTAACMLRRTPRTSSLWAKLTSRRKGVTIKPRSQVSVLHPFLQCSLKRGAFPETLMDRNLLGPPLSRRCNVPIRDLTRTWPRTSDLASSIMEMLIEKHINIPSS